MAEDALAVAHEAKHLATKALTMVDSIQPQLTSIAMSVEGMRRENADQHRENARLNSDNFKEVHTRISTIKTTIEANRTAAQKEIQDVDIKVAAKMDRLNTRWVKYRDKVILFLVAVVIALLADKLKVHIPEFWQ